MKERPILMSAPMVRAILEGRKSQTRRVMKPQPQPNGIWSKSLGDFLCLIDEYPPSATIWNGAWLGADAGELNCCPFGIPGDRLWVRESHWRYTGCAPAPSAFAQSPNGDPYNARCYDDLSDLHGFIDSAILVRVPSIHMPRWASRITLEIKSVRVERVQEISEEDARAEGVEKAEATDGALSYALGFSDLWDSINAKRGYGWDTNPWVWVVEFERVDYWTPGRC